MFASLNLIGKMFKLIDWIFKIGIRTPTPLLTCVSL